MKKRILSLLFINSLILSSCGDAQNEASVEKSLGAINEVSSLADAPECNAVTDGDVIYVQKDDQHLFCAGESQSWTKIDLDKALSESGISELNDNEVVKIQIGTNGSLEISTSTGQSGTITDASALVDPDAINNTRNFAGARIVASAESLPTCDVKSKGWLFYVQADAGFVYCDGKNYENIDLEGTDGLNGKDGEDGKDGQKGDDGSSCSVKDNGDGSKTISCEDGTSVDITDGQDGIDGQGSDFHVGSGAPLKSLGRDGDTYIDIDSDTYYSKKSGSWSQVVIGISVTASAGVGGSISPNGVIPVAKGGDKEFTATANNGYCFDRFKIEGAGFPNYSYTNPTSLTNVYSGRTIQAEFSTACNFNVNVSANAGGTVSKIGNNSVGRNGSISVTWTVNPGFILTGVKLDGQYLSESSSLINGNTLTLTGVQKDFTVEVTFRSASEGLVLDDFSVKNESMFSSNGRGIWFLDNDKPSGGTSKVELQRPNGTYFEGALALSINDCPLGESQSSPGTSACYWGWNHKDAYVDGGLKFRTYINEWIDPNVDWPWASAGIYYGFDYDPNSSGSSNFEKLRPAGLSLNDSFVIEFKYPLGKELTLSLYDPSNNGNNPRPKVKLVGTGDWETTIVPVSSFNLGIFENWSGYDQYKVGNVISKVIALGILREEAASSKGESIRPDQQGYRFVGIKTFKLVR